MKTVEPKNDPQVERFLQTLDEKNSYLRTNPHPNITVFFGYYQQSD